MFKSAQDGSRRQIANPCRCQLDRQRSAVQPNTNSGDNDCVLGAHRELPVDGRRPVYEQPAEGGCGSAIGGIGLVLDHVIHDVGAHRQGHCER